MKSWHDSQYVCAFSSSTSSAFNLLARFPIMHFQALVLCSSESLVLCVGEVCWLTAPDPRLTNRQSSDVQAPGEYQIDRYRDIRTGVIGNLSA
ncbi:hypothetical protein RRG08_050791 [Elysia crispata]|uniref:Uncharacterized protein n=1 Tax=Elysia crispata TaxID=231223 RepID=A0AAE0YGQ5_9GAST|nr:hypothetical protein RRG08_050791 [Elysia crispata]